MKLKITRRTLVFLGGLLIELIVARIFGMKIAIGSIMVLISTAATTQWAHMIYTNKAIFDTLATPIRFVEDFINKLLRKI